MKLFYVSRVGGVAIPALCNHILIISIHVPLTFSFLHIILQTFTDDRSGSSLSFFLQHIMCERTYPSSSCLVQGDLSYSIKPATMDLCSIIHCGSDCYPEMNFPVYSGKQPLRHGSTLFVPKQFISIIAPHLWDSLHFIT